MTADPGGPPLVVDARGRRCPLPVLELAKAAATLPAGALVVVLSDDPASAVDVPAWCEMKGAALVGTAAAVGGGTAYRVRVGG